MVNRIEIGFRKNIRDALGEKVKRRIVENLQIHVERVSTIDVFTIEGDLTKTDLRKAATGPLSDPVIQKHAIDSALAEGFDWLIEVGFRPGVTDNVGKTATEAIELLIEKRKPLKVYTSRQYVIRGEDRPQRGAERIASGVLANDLIERCEIVEGKGWDPKKGMKPYVPKVAGEDDPRVDEIDLNVPDSTLMGSAAERDPRPFARGDEGHPGLHERPAGHRGPERNRPRGVDHRRGAGSASPRPGRSTASTRSSTPGSRYEDGERQDAPRSTPFSAPASSGSTQEIRERLGADDWCLSVFTDNAGVIRFNDDWNLVFKVETHNSPSALDPYGGALTGIVGVNRDPFGTRQWAPSSSSTRTSSALPTPSTTSRCRSGSCTRGGSTRGCARASSTAATRAASPR